MSCIKENDFKERTPLRSFWEINGKASGNKFRMLFFSPTRGHLDNLSINQGQSWLTTAALQKVVLRVKFYFFSILWNVFQLAPLWWKMYTVVHSLTHIIFSLSLPCQTNTDTFTQYFRCLKTKTKCESRVSSVYNWSIQSGTPYSCSHLRKEVGASELPRARFDGRKSFLFLQPWVDGLCCVLP